MGVYAWWEIVTDELFGIYTIFYSLEELTLVEILIRSWLIQ